jgi:hypothetical protein
MMQILNLPKKTGKECQQRYATPNQGINNSHPLIRSLKLNGTKPKNKHSSKNIVRWETSGRPYLII